MFWQLGMDENQTLRAPGRCQLPSGLFGGYGFTTFNERFSQFMDVKCHWGSDSRGPGGGRTLWSPTQPLIDTYDSPVLAPKRRGWESRLLVATEQPGSHTPGPSHRPVKSSTAEAVFCWLPFSGSSSLRTDSEAEECLVGRPSSCVTRPGWERSGWERGPGHSDAARTGELWDALYFTVFV